MPGAAKGRIPVSASGRPADSYHVGMRVIIATLGLCLVFAGLLPAQQPNIVL
ncbi:MAG: hypothetical protein ACI89X_002432, partial [Planctomycetota bacterium]